MDGKKILVVEDEAGLVSMIQRGLSMDGYRVSVALDGPSGMQLVSTYQYDLITLDLMLPGMGGLELCRTIRKQNGQVPILMLTALGTPENIVTGLDGGADDYLVKLLTLPYSMPAFAR